jgi:hypothetical protein
MSPHLYNSCTGRHRQAGMERTRSCSRQQRAGKAETSKFPALAGLVAQQPEGVGVTYIAPIRALSNTTTEAVTASLMGHTSSMMVRRVYGRIGSDAKREALAKLPPLAPPPGVMLSVIDEPSKPTRKRPERQLPAGALSIKKPQMRGFVVPRDRTESNCRHEDFQSLCRGWYLVEITTLFRLRVAHCSAFVAVTTAQLGAPGTLLAMSSNFKLSAPARRRPPAS